MDVHRKVAYSRRCCGRPVRNNQASDFLHAQNHAINCHASLAAPSATADSAIVCSSRTAVAPLERLKILMQIQGSKGIYTGVWQVMQRQHDHMSACISILLSHALLQFCFNSQTHWHMPFRDASICMRGRACEACFKGMAPTVSGSSPIRLLSSWHTSRSHGEALQAVKDLQALPCSFQYTCFCQFLCMI